MKKIFILLFVCTLLPILIQAQTKVCGTDIQYNRQKSRNPFLVEAERSYESMLQDKIIERRSNRDGEDVVLIIPVVFHIIHEFGPENISDAQVLDALEVLNRDYQKMNSDTIEIANGFNAVAANVRIEFRLATKDFLGNCVNGIERIQSIETYIGDNGSKLNQWPRHRYLNIWTVASMENGVAGYSQYPSAVIDGLSAKADGVIILHNYVGRIGTGSEFNSRALTHEVGHYLDLQHTWGSNNSPEVECGDDLVEDTPTTKGHSSCQALVDYTCNSQTINGTTANEPTFEMVYNFGGLTVNSGTIDPTSPPVGIFENDSVARLALSNFSAHGISIQSSENGAMGFSDWGLGASQGDSTYTNLEGSINTSQYYEFTITPSEGSAMTLSGLSFDMARNESGIRTYAVRSSIGGFNSGLSGSIIPPNPLITFPTPSVFFLNADVTDSILDNRVSMNYSNITAPVTFRIYAWNAEDETGTFVVDNVKLYGTFGRIENIQNYMEYAYCSRMFTQGQKERMRAALAINLADRNNLSTAENLVLTGTDDSPLSCAPKADFFPEYRFVCVGDEVQYFDNSTNGTATSWNWTFQDGIPATSTEQNPTVSFLSAGRKTISLTVSNQQGVSTSTYDENIAVSSSSSEIYGSLIQEGFDSQDGFNWNWIPFNYDLNQSAWHQVSNAGYSNNTCAMLNGYDMDITFIDEGGNDIDELVSPAMNLTNIQSNGVCTFQWSYATQSTSIADITDRLEVYISNNCGRTWSNQPRLVLSGLELVTVGNSSIAFFPTESSQWSLASFTIPTNYYNDGFRIKFIFYAGQYPNNLFIDDVNMEAVLSLNEVESDFYGARIFPNPAGDVASLSYFNSVGTSMEISLTDTNGRLIEKWNAANQSPGKQTRNINTAQLSKGVYFVRLISTFNSTTLKLVVN
jgi:PKD repeat protein